MSVPKVAYVIRPGRIDEASHLQDVERAAGKVFLAVGMADIADSDPTSIAHFHARSRQGRLLVATPNSGGPAVGFLYWSNRDGCAYIEEVAVDPLHRGFRLAGRMFDTLATEVGRGIKALTLATFRDVPWNAPYYARLGFVECDCALLGPGHEKERQKHSFGATKQPSDEPE